MREISEFFVWKEIGSGSRSRIFVIAVAVSRENGSMAAGEACF